jgi:hypothetical protein
LYAKSLTFLRLRQFVKRPLLAQRKRVISWPILAIVYAHLQPEHAKRDKIESNNDNVSK